MLAIIIAIVLGYSAYSLYPLVSGPSIEITSPKPGEKIESNVIKIKGVIKRAKEVKIFDRVISIDPEGNFEEEIVRQDAYTDIVITVKDKYGRVINKKIFAE
jgi:hypothetical protein